MVLHLTTSLTGALYDPEPPALDRHPGIVETDADAGDTVPRPANA